MAVKILPPKKLAKQIWSDHSGAHLHASKKNMFAMLFVAFILFFGNAAHAQLALENFSNGIPTTWAQVNTPATSATWGISTDGYLDSSAAYINPGAVNIGAGNTSTHYLITPLVTVPANGEISFYTKQSDVVNHGNIYQVRISTAGQTDPAGFSTILATWTESELNTTTPVGYERKTVAIPSSITPGLGVYIAFVVINDQPGATPDADTWYIDNVSVTSAQVCAPVLADSFQAAGISTTSATLSWSHATATNFEIQVVANNETPGATGTATGSIYNATGLEPGTTYDVYIKTLCSSSSSVWAGPFEFTTRTAGTSCDTAIVIPVTNTPYVYASNLDLFQNPDVTYTTHGNSCLPATVTENYLNGDKAFFTYTPTQNGYISIKQLTLPYAQGTGCFGNALTGVFVYEDCASVGVNCLAGLNTTTTDVPKYISNLYVESGHTYVIVISSVFDSATSICFNFELNFSVCPAPNLYSYKDLLQTSVSVSWNNPSNVASSWQYVVQPAGAGVPTGAGTVTNTNVDNLINTGLAAGTAYELYVRSVCNGTPGGWGTPYPFTTQCTPFSTPYTESFDGATESDPTACWTPININDDDVVWRNSWENFMISTGNNAANNNDMIVSPTINLGTTPKRLKFKYQTSGGVSRFSVVLSTTGIGVSNFTTVIMPTISQDTDYEVVEKIVNIPTNITGNVNIAWYVDPGADETAYSLILDDVVVEDKPECSDPLALTAEDITTAAANLSWEAGDAEAQWQIVVQPKDTGVPVGTGILVSDNAYAATGLTHATQYEYYVRAYCSSSQQSNWAGPFYFTTLCSIFETPFYESFNDSDPGTHKSCWTTNDVNEDGAAWQITANETSIQGNRFWGTPSYDDWLISPAINVVGTKALKFDYRSAFSIFYPNPRFGIEVLMSTTDTNPESFSVVMPLMTFTNIEYLQKTIYITANGPVYIAFRVPPAFSTVGGTSILNIDNVRIEDAPACPDPSALTASGITQNAATLAWSTGHEETQWEIKVQPAGTGVPTTAGTLTSNNTAYPATSLLPNTTYEYYVRAYCNATEQSQWVGPFTFTTLCEAFTTPFTETFNINSVSEACWRVINGNSDSYTWNTNITIDTYEGNQTAGMFTGSNGANDDWLISPTITVRAGQRLRYYYRVYSSDFHEDIEVKLSTNGIAPAEFTTMLYERDFYDDPPLNNVEWKEKIINIPAGIVGNVNIAWHIPQKEANWEGYRGQMLLVDNVVIEDIPACPAPSNLAINGVTDTTTTLTWDANGSETQWYVYVQPAELDAPVGDGDAQYRSLVSTNPYTAEGLTPAQKYEYYVKSVCSGTTTSEWVGPFEFTTMCSFENLCEYTVTLSGGPTGGVGGGIDVMQNGVKLQTMEFPTSAWNEVPVPVDFTLFLCTGVEFSLFWDAVGTAPGQYPGATVTVTNNEGNVVWTGDLGNITPRSTIYRAISTCGAITCPQPTGLAVSGTSVLSWTPGGTETQWEVSIQPVANNTLPQSGTIVTTNSYTPQDSDFLNLQSGSYEFFVRAICGGGDTSFWSGPHAFVRNDDASKAISLPVNTGEVCEQSITTASFMGATASAEPMSCNGANAGDVWFDFVAASKVHIVQLSNFSARHQYEAGNSADVVEPKITMTLYKVNGAALQEMACTYNNVILAAYSTELEVGATYKVRLTLNGTLPNISTFDVCVTTPADACGMDIVNGGFESPQAGFGGLGNFYSQNIVPGWRNNLLETDAPSLYETMYIQSGLGLDGFTPYEGGQMVQLMAPESDQPLPDPADLVNIKGMFQDLDSSEITKYAYSFAYLSRSQGNAVQLYAGPPAGPFELLEEQTGVMTWSNYEGTYNVPAGQNVTRFIFRAKDNGIGNILDAVSIVAQTAIITQPLTLSCTQASTTLEAEGVGIWTADAANPSQVTFTNAASANTTVNGFTRSGAYKLYWTTRYCQESIIITSQANDAVPVVTTPVTYCQNAQAVALTAPALTGYTLVWYDVALGGTALAGAPVPATTATGSTNYYVAYVNSDGCEGSRAAIEVVVNQATAVITEFSYAEKICLDTDETILPVTAEGFRAGGTYTSATLTVNAATGQIDVTSATVGRHTVTYTVTSNTTECLSGGTYSFEIEFTAPVTPVTAFTFAESYCVDSTNALPELTAGFTAGGTFSAPQGVVINPQTGEIDITASQSGTYEIKYTVAAANCNVGGSSTDSVTIYGNISATITQECRDNDTWLIATVTGTSDDANFKWTDASGAEVGSGNAEFNITDYYSNTTITLPLDITVTVSVGSCTALAQHTVESIMCNIPKGISPDNDGLNDSFDLTGMEVDKITIFNRYGLEVWHFNGRYTNQWHGQDSNNKELPTGTYFYSITQAGGKNVTGWVYINKKN